MTSAAPDPERVKKEFFDLGLQYYVAARYAAFAGLNPVAANLFHHSVEMFMKGVLAPLGLVELKKLGHQMQNIWSRLKAENPSAGYSTFDPLVAQLDKFEGIRYPDRILAEGMQSWINLHPHGGSAMSMTRPEPRYELAVPDIDRLIKVLFDVGSINPPFFTNSFNADARSYMLRDPQASSWPRAGVSNPETDRASWRLLV